MLFSSILAWSMTFLLSYECLEATTSWSIQKQLRSFKKIGCEGSFVERLFDETDNICESCDRFYPNQGVGNLCRQNCFGTVYFNSCISFLLLREEYPQIQITVKQLQRTDTGLSEVTTEQTFTEVSSEKIFPEKLNTTEQHKQSENSSWLQVKKMFWEYVEYFGKYGANI